MESDVDTESLDVGLAETIAPAEPGAATEHTGQGAATGDEAAALGDRPESDALARKVARAKIAGKLFAVEERVKLGRYHLLELVGSGGMGVVWGAWDPELDRRVAIKLVKATMRAARDRILLEGQALAKLSHPNVVPVFDVGIFEEQVYLVMEWVRGKNLRAYCKEPRSVREIVAVYRQAGEGLWAAHGAGLIHRDFKPDNAIRGDDGRVRVLDFGLAREGVRKDTPVGGDDTPVPSSDATRGAGTPRYMPPEQAEGRVLTPAVDQFAFCVSLREALVGRDATTTGKDALVPAWLDRIITRGSAPDPKGRFPSMEGLLHELARDPATVRRRRLVAAGALGAVGAAFAVGAFAGTDDVERCSGGKAEMARTWNRDVRASVIDHITKLGTYGAEEASRIDGALATYGERWATAHRDACLARERGELTAQLYERNLACLTRAKVSLDAVVGVLGTVPKERLSDAVVAVTELPRVAVCATDASASTVAPPPANLAPAIQNIANLVARARVLALAAEPAAPFAAGAAATAAEVLGYTPLIAQAHLTTGFAFQQQQRFAEAATPLTRATLTALAAEDDITAVEAFARDTYVVSLLPAEALEPGAKELLGAIPIIEPIARRLGARGAFGRTLFFNNLGVTRMAAGDTTGASRWFQTALAERSAAKGTGTFELANIPANMALITENEPERERFFQQSLTELATELGPNHPQTITIGLGSAGLRGNPSVAIPQVRDHCERYRRYHPHLQFQIEQCEFELGWMLAEAGDAEGARSAFEHVRTEPRSIIAGAFREVLSDKFAEVAESMEKLGDTIAKAPEWFQRIDAADAYLVAARAFEGLGRADRALACLEKALPILGDAEQMLITRRRGARVRALVAKAIARRDPRRAAELATKAVAWYRAAGGYDAMVAELEPIARAPAQ